MDAFDQYRSLAAPAQGLFKDKGSRFLALAFPVETEEQVKETVAALRKEHHDARHHGYAYRLGYKGDVFRSSDDGEPSGTAGQPILQSLKQKELQNVVLAVVRYFGGIQLGVRGLIDTYRAAAELVLAETERVKKQAMEEIPFSCPYSFYNTLLYKTEKLEGRVENAVFGEIVQGRAVVPRTAAPQIKAFLEEIKHS